jgi:hypothetical protein
MKFSNMIFGIFLALSLNSYSYAEEHTKTEGVKENCITQPTTTATLNYSKAVPIDTNLGKLYEDYMNQVKALLNNGNFINFKIVSQSLTPYLDKSAESYEITISVSIEFDLNYKAITELATLNRTNVSIQTYNPINCP